LIRGFHIQKIYKNAQGGFVAHIPVALAVWRSGTVHFFHGDYDSRRDACSQRRSPDYTAKTSAKRMGFDCRVAAECGKGVTVNKKQYRRRALIRSTGSAGGLCSPTAQCLLTISLCISFSYAMNGIPISNLYVGSG